MARPRTRAEAIAWCGRKLGDGVVVVEMTPEQIDDAWDDALDWFISNRGVIRVAVATYSGPGTYTLPDDVDTVLSVAFPGVSWPSWDYESGVLVDVESAYSYYGKDTDFSTFYSTIMLWMQRKESAQRLTSMETHWDWRPETRTLQVFPSSRQQSGSIIVEYVSSLVYDEDPASSSGHPNDLRRMPRNELTILLDYFVAEARERLGEIRGKYADGLPSAGGNKVLNGPDLIQAAREAKERLTEKLENLGMAPILTG